ncbi:exosortase N [Nibribacter koreensis]|uniref:Exosortase N n=1 Tax=Nibribacter koreensis TaxID=1084519 RepID=A0ABP8FD59_9BACT
MSMNTQWPALAWQKHRLNLLVVTAYAVVAYLFLSEYLLWDAQWVLGLLLLPLVALPTGQRKPSYVLLAGTLLLLALAAFYQITTVYFFAFVLACWFAAQMLVGKISVYPFLMLLVVSPIFTYVADILSFPLRLQLTQWAAGLLRLLYSSTEVAGNILLVNGEEFSVDPACAGLNMLSFSLTMAILVLAHLQRTHQKAWPLWLSFGLLAGMVVLNVASNLLRILVLVLFKIMPDQVMHDVVGMACLILYAVLPFYFLARHLHQKLPVQPVLSEPSGFKKPASILSLNVILLLLFIGAGLRLQKKVDPMAQAPAEVAGFTQEALPSGVRKISSPETLIYVKPIRAFYSTEHHPLICWEGSGYLFKHVQTRLVTGREIYVGQLEKGKDRLYTAWWMDNGTYQTITQSDWRWRMFMGEAPFQLVNVTASSEEQLTSSVKQLLRTNSLALGK